MALDILLQLGLFVLSLGVLLKASDWFVNSAEQIGLSLGLSPLVVGVTIIAFGTSLPELASSIASVYAGESEIVVGNVVGSNITNILLILGLTAIVGKEVRLELRILGMDIPLLAGSAILLWFALRDLQFSKAEAILFATGLALFLLNTFQSEEKAKAFEAERPATSWRTYAMLVVGGALVYIGATYTIAAIQRISELARIESEVIALTLVALGTSLPELVVSLTAARKGKTAIAVGNVIGSNVFNTYAVMAIPGLLGDLVIPGAVIEFSLPLMVGVTFLLVLVSINHRISRWEGSLLLLFYLFFLLELLKGVV
ncbi:MAG: calcium/sodium antiporter [Saprospiraceae bacterium]|nr:calcium/sodium antiporter [Saprospiraceae bacterium]